MSLFSLALRYPNGHEVGVDSFSIQALADLISSTGSIGWLVSPLSYLGLAPFSYSPAVPVALASLEQLGGINGEPTAILYSLFLGAILPETAFMFGYSAFRKSSIALLVAFLISTAGGMVDFTASTVSTRGTFLTFTPLVLAFYLDTVTGGTRARKSRTAMIPILATLILTHAMFFIFLPMMLAAYILYQVVVVEDRLLRRKASASLRRRVSFSSLGVTGLVIASLVALGPASQTFDGFPALTGRLIPDTLVTRIGVQWVTLMGLGAVLLPIGLIRLPKLAERKRGLLLSALVLTFIPLALNPVYGILVAIPAVLLVSALGIWPSGITGEVGPTGQLSRTALIAIAASLAIVIAPAVVTIPRSSGVPCSEPEVIDLQTYNTGIYLRHLNLGNSSFVWDDHIEAQRLEAVSGVPSLEPVESIGDLSYPWISQKMDVRFYRSTAPTDILTSGTRLLDAKEWLTSAGLDYPYYWGKHTFVLLQRTPDSPEANEILGFYRASIAVERCNAGQSVFYGALHTSSYVLYEDELQRAYWIRGYS